MKRKQTFCDDIEREIEEAPDKKQAIRIQAFIRAAEYLADIVKSGNDCDEHPTVASHLNDELIYKCNGESGAFASDFTADLIEIVKLGVDARKRWIMGTWGSFSYDLPRLEEPGSDDEATKGDD